MKHLKRLVKLLALVAILAVTGCTTIETRTVYVKPTCEIPPTPSYPYVNEDWLREILGQEAFTTLDKVITMRDGHIFELEMMLIELCEDPG